MPNYARIDGDIFTVVPCEVVYSVYKDGMSEVDYVERRMEFVVNYPGRMEKYSDISTKALLVLMNAQAKELIPIMIEGEDLNKFQLRYFNLASIKGR